MNNYENIEIPSNSEAVTTLYGPIYLNKFYLNYTLKFGVDEAVTTLPSIFNDGHAGKCKLLKEIGSKPGKNLVIAIKSLDYSCIHETEKAHQELEKINICTC